MSVLLINQGWTDNLGDIAIKEVMEYHFRHLAPVSLPFAPNVANNVADGLVQKVVSLYQLDKVYRTEFTAYVKKLLEKPKAAIIGGGELLGTNMNFNSALKEWVAVLRRHSIPVYLYGVSGNRLNVLYEYRLRQAIRQCTDISVRDMATQKVLCERYGMKVPVYPDVVFTFGKMYGTQPTAAQLEKHDILCNILSYDYYVLESRGNIAVDNYYEIWAVMLEAIKNDNDSIMLGSTTVEDQYTAKGFEDYLIRTRSWHVGVSYAETPAQFWEQLSCVKAVVTGRMHAMILAMQQGCTCHPFIFKEKIDQFKREYVDTVVDMESIVNMAEDGLTSLISRVMIL